MDGQRRTFTSAAPGSKGKIAAEKKADHWLDTMLVGENTRCEILLEQYFQRLEQTTSTSHWHQQDNYIHNYILPAIGSKRIGRVTEHDLQKIIDKANAEKGLAKKTLANLRGCCVAFLKFCRRQKCTQLVPEGLILPAGAVRSRKGVLPPDDLATLFQAEMTSWCRGVHKDWYLYAYRFEVLTGLRPGELLGLQWDDLRGQTLTIHRAVNDYNENTAGKNDNAIRSIVVDGLAMEELEAQRQQLLEAGVPLLWIFPGRTGSVTTQQNYRKSWARFRRFNGMSGGITPYELRHTYVSTNDGMPDGLKKKVIGHSASMDTEGVYGHLMAGDLARAAQYSDAAFRALLGRGKDDSGIG